MTERLRHFLFLAGEDVGDAGRWRDPTRGILKS